MEKDSILSQMVKVYLPTLPFTSWMAKLLTQFNSYLLSTPSVQSPSWNDQKGYSLAGTWENYFASENLSLFICKMGIKFLNSPGSQNWDKLCRCTKIIIMVDNEK